MKKATKTRLLAFLAIAAVLNVKAQISGTVYLDINNSGTRTVAPATPFEPGVFGVTVKAFNASGIQTGSTTTNAAGAYSLPGVTSFPVRLEFTTPDNLFSGKRPAAAQSNVQFIAATTTTANYAVGYNTMYTSNANPFIATNGAINGNAIGGGTSGTAQNLFVLPYSFNNTITSVGGANYQNRWLGSVFGITFQRETRTLLMAAYLKRHIGFGPGGIDAIYRTVVNASGNAAQPSILLELANLGINVGTDPRSGALPAASNTPNTDLGVFGQIGKRGIGNIDLAENGKDLYVTNLFENKIHRINIGMPVKSSFTAADVTGTWTIAGPGLAGTEWHIMGVKYYQGKIYVGGVSSIQRSTAPVASAADLAADHVNLRGYVYQLDPLTGTITEVMQFPFNYRRGYCNSDHRYEFKNNYWRAWQNNGDADVLRGDINTLYTPFVPPTGNNTGIYYPQPMLSDIEFDVDGSMIIAVRDRFGDQTGYNNYLEGANGQTPVPPIASDNRLFRGLNSGEVLRAGKSGASWNIENNAVVTTNSVATNTNAANIQGTPPGGAPAIGGTWNPAAGTPWGWGAGVGQGFGPGGRYYYYNHAFTAAGVPVANIQDGTVGVITSHYLKSNGGMTLMAGYDEMIHTAMDVDGVAFTSGLLRFANKGEATGTNAGNMTDQQQLLPWPPGTSPPGSPNPDPTTMGKSNGMGDVELLLEAMPIEIGNRIWNDLNANGIQDANETGIGGITVTLRSPGTNGIFGDGDDQTWTTTTSSVAGQVGVYYFDNTAAGGNVNDSRSVALGFIGLPAGNTGILNSQNYRIEIDPSQVNLTNYRVSASDIGGALGDNIDNDGSQANLSGVGVRTFANVNTSNNDYNFDFGFTPKASLGNKVWLDMGAGGGTANNGLQDGAEPGVAGISVLLYTSTNGTVGDGDDVLISSTVTDAYGLYRFDNLTTGTNYFVKVLPPPNYTISTQTNTANDQGNDATGSDVNGTATGAAYGASYMVVVTAGENEPDVDAGVVFSQPASQSIGDRIWFDANNNGVDNSEPGVAGVVVSLYRDLNNDGDLDDAGETVPYAATVTDADGYYNFTNLPTGNYQVGTTLPAGFTYTTYNAGGGTLGDPAESNTDSDIQTVGVAFGKTPILNLGAGENLVNVDAGLSAVSPATTASVGDFVWNDLDQDGIQDAGEPGLAGVTVTLYAFDGTTVLATTVTNAFGGYMFNGLTGGTSYVIGITPLAGYTVSPQDAAANNNIDSDINTTTFKTVPFNLPNGIRNTTIDAGLYQTAPAGTARLGDKVWFDNGIGGGSAADGIQNGTEPGLAGVTVSVYRNGPDGLPGTADDVLVGTTVTDVNGNYQFVNLAASAGVTTEYNVGFSNLPPRYSFTPVWSSNDANATNSDANPGTGRTGTINLSGGESEQDVDAGLVAGLAAGKGSMGNKVFYDLDGDGIQDAGETGVAGVTVTLQKDLNNDGDFADAGEASFATQTTNSLGEYLYTGLDAGSYRVVFSNGPVGYTISPAHLGTNDAIDSDGSNAGSAISAVASTTPAINLGVGEDNLTVDLGIVKTSATTGSISDRVWFDVNNDGDRDNGTEPGVAGVTVILYDASGTVLAITTTDVNGYYLFDNLAAKTTALDYYQVGFSNYPPGLTPTVQTATITNNFSAAGADGKTQQINLAAGQNRSDVDLGLISTRATLGNFVWLDNDGDGLQDAGENGIAGVTVLLYFDSNNDGDFSDPGENVPAASMITDQNGLYLFSNLNAGNYQVEFTTVPGGLSFTQQNGPGDNGDNTNCDANLSGRTGTINLAAGEADLSVDAGLYKPTATVGNFIWADNNINNVQDAGDQGVAGVLVTLYTSAGVPVSTTVTDKNGQYLFTNVPPGSYYVGFANTPNGSLFVIADQGGNDALDSDVNNANGAGSTATFTVPHASENITMDAGLVYLQALPVRLQFTAYKRNTTSALAWTVSGDITSVKRYVIERAADGRTYSLLFSQTADSRTNYLQSDVQPLTGINYYRIRIEYLDGKIEYSEIRIIRFDSNGLITVFPNPASSTVYISLPDSWQGKRVTLELINELGQVVLIQSQNQASQVEVMDISRLAPGMYSLRMMNNEKNAELRKIQVMR